MNVLAQLQQAFAEALATLIDDPEQYRDMIRPAQDARFGDYQANMAMPLAKRLGQSPRAIAEQLVAILDVEQICEVAGDCRPRLH